MKNKHVAVLLTAFIVIAIDQITKFLVKSNFELNQSLPLINNIFHLTYIHNFGAAFGILQEQRFILVFVSVAVIVAILYYLRKVNEKERIPQSIEVPQLELTKTENWISTQGDLFLKLSHQAYQEGDYTKAKHYWQEAIHLKPATGRYENLGRAIGEAMVLKTIYIDKLEERKTAKLAEQKIEKLLLSAQTHI